MTVAERNGRGLLVTWAGAGKTKKKGSMATKVP